MKKTVSVLTITAALALSLAACGKPAAERETPQPQLTAETQAPAEASGTASAPVRQDGERFDAVIMLEGMEETVHYEHLRNEALGFEMDYDYEVFARYTDADRERFVSTWEDAADPDNYLEIRADAGDAALVADAVSTALSAEYEVYRVSRTLDRAGECIMLEASVIKGTNSMAPEMQTVYIIPAPDGCRVATLHCAIESSEGFGRRTAFMLNTLSAFARS